MSTIETNIDVSGLANLETALNQLTARMAKKAVDGAITYAKTPMLKDAQEKAAKAEADHRMKYALAPAPYFRPAFEQNKQLFLDRFCQKLRQNIDKYGGSAWMQDNDFAQF